MITPLPMIPHRAILPPGQRVFWDQIARSVPNRFVLYGGTAVALRYGHRTSVDFDYFTDQPLDVDDLRRALPILDAGEILKRSPDTLLARVAIEENPVKLSFFGGLDFGRVGTPDVIQGHAALAAPLDLLATKLKALHDRIEPKDYVDIAVLLENGLTLNQGIAAAMALFGSSLNPFDTAKAVAWFKDGDLDRKLSALTKACLKRASEGFDPQVKPAPILSRSLAPTAPRTIADPAGTAGSGRV